MRALSKSNTLIRKGIDLKGAQVLKGNAFRHQMVLPEQQAIYDYWRSKCHDGKIPSRHDIDPSQIVGFLPTVSLIEVCWRGSRPRFMCRLAGTGFWDLYDEEIQGRYVDELPLGDRCDYWARILSRVTENRRATAGVTRPGTPLGGHLAQFWVRLPLSENGQDVNMILGYDHLVKMTDIPQPSEARERITA